MISHVIISAQFQVLTKILLGLVQRLPFEFEFVDVGIFDIGITLEFHICQFFEQFRHLSQGIIGKVGLVLTQLHPLFNGGKGFLIFSHNIADVGFGEDILDLDDDRRLPGLLKVIAFLQQINGKLHQPLRFLHIPSLEHELALDELTVAYLNAVLSKEELLKFHVLDVVDFGLFSLLAGGGAQVHVEVDARDLLVVIPRLLLLLLAPHFLPSHTRIHVLLSGLEDDLERFL